MRMENDFMMRVVLKDHAVRLAFGSFREVAATGIINHDTDPVAGRLLAGGLVAGSLMSVLLNEEERYSIRIDYKGPAKGILLDISGKGEVRGFICNPHVMTAADSIENACGAGATVSVTKSENGKILNSGQAESAFITPASALSYFLSVSDQVETEIRSEILLQPAPSSPVRCAYAVMIQALPDCDLEFFNQMREQLLSETAGKILSDPVLMEDRKLEALAMLLCKSAEPPAMDIAGVPAPRFVCNCSAGKIWQTAKTVLGKEEFEKILQENPNPAIRCQFCNKVHHYKD